MNLIIGCGYLGMRIARLWLAEEHPVAALTRSAKRAEEFRQLGLYPVIGDVTEPRTLLPLANLVEPNDTIVHAVGHDRMAGPSLREVYVAGLLNVLAALRAPPRKIIYISSTGVYGQNDGSWIDEDSPTEPFREAGRICLEAEQALCAHPFGARAIILRMAGIYGPGRVPNRADLQAGKALPVDPQAYLNLIHVADAARIVLLAEEKATTPRTFVVSDGQPLKRHEFYEELARIWQTPSPAFAPPAERAALSAMRHGSNKRVNSARMMRELAPSLLFPDYRQGLADCARGGG
jgi:nucleoside-diphosphate-sugar epimerase